jgi:hypothetical protein
MKMPKNIKLDLIFYIIGVFFLSFNIKSQNNYARIGQNNESNSFYLKNLGSIKSFSLDKFTFGAFYGVNFSQVIPIERSSIFSNNSNESFEKDYTMFYRNFGTQFGIILNYNLSKIFTIGLYPSLTDYSYRYENIYQWSGNTNLQYQANIMHRLNFFELPLILGIHTTFKKWQPYYQGGIYYGHFKGSNTSFSVVETSPNLAGTNQTISYSTTVNSSDQYVKNQYGLLAGVGIAYVLGGLKIGLEGNLKFLMSNLNTIESRYQNNIVVSGNYDVPDRFKFSNLSINLNITVPLVCKNQSGKNGSLFCE